MVRRTRCGKGSGAAGGGALLLLLGGLAGACSSPQDGTGGQEGQGGSGGSGGGMYSGWEPKVDLLLTIDNSPSMADKQQLLALAVPDLVSGLVNPPCVDAATGEVAAAPEGPLDACPEGAKRRFEPVRDMHIGVVTSSLGGHGSDACSDPAVPKQAYNDKGHLVARKVPGLADKVPTYQEYGFLAWDPDQALSPPGEADVGADGALDADGTALSPSLREMVLGAGETGCGYEAQLEAWYRFLADPTPPETVTLDEDGKVLLEGIDQVLLAQRRLFLRPGSVLAILLLSDENDCSIREQGQFYYAAQLAGPDGLPYHLPRARQVCAEQPDDPCCFSCGQTGPKDDDGNPICPLDPTCKTADGETAVLDPIDDDVNLRCFDQKRRFGIDFLYKTDRYVEALRSLTLTDRAGQVVDNPIFSDLDPSDGDSWVRGPESVILAGIVGVPWQDIARQSAGGVPDLLHGLDAAGKAAGGFKSAAELSAELPGKDYSTWDLILGDPAQYPAESALPRDPLMRESVEPRAGENPVTGDPLVTSATPLGNKINGHEYAIPSRDSLQYACIFPLTKTTSGGEVSPAPRDCMDPEYTSCDCQDPSSDDPLCQADPATGDTTVQVYAKAFPGLRELTVLRDLGEQGVVASVCPAQVAEPAERDFGYRPAVAALVERIGVALSP